MVDWAHRGCRLRRELATLGLALALATGALALAVLSAQAQEGQSAFAGGGASALVEQARSMGITARRLASGPLGLEGELDPATTLLVVVAPARPYTAEEQAKATAFLRSGGRALVADNFGEAASLTAPWGIAFERVRLVEENATPPVHRLEGHAIPLAPRHPTALRLTGSLPAAAASSPTSFLDRDGNGLIGAGDPRGPFPLLAEAGVGEGAVLAASDPTLLAPAGGDDPPANAAWRQAVLQHLLPDGGTVLVDESKTATDDPVVAGLGAAVATAGSTIGSAVLGGLALLLLVAAAVPRIRNLWVPHRFRPDHFVRRAQAQPAAGAPAAAQQDGWTARGMAAVLACPALAFAALVEGSREAAWGAAILGVLAAAALLPGRARVRASRQLADVRVSEETPVPVELRLEPLAGALEVEARDALPSEFDLVEGTNWVSFRLPRGGRRWTYTVRPALRGPYPVGPLVLRRMDPFGLHVYEAVAAPAATVEVQPRRQPLNRVPFTTRVPSVTLGPHLVNRAGDGSEFHSLREYQEGDSFRAINWRASARSKGLVVSQRVHESMTTVTLFLDARAVSGAGPASATPLADGCRAALSLAAGALQVRDRVRLLVYGAGVRELEPGRGARQVHELTDLLAALAPAGNTPFGEAVAKVLPYLRPGNPVILLSGLEGDPSVPESMRALRSRGQLTLVVASPLGTAPRHADEGGPEPDAAAIAAGRAATLRELRAAGIPTLETRPGVPLDYLFRMGGVT